MNYPPPQLLRLAVQTKPVLSLQKALHGVSLYWSPKPTHQLQDLPESQWGLLLTDIEGNPLLTPSTLSELTLTQQHQLAQPVLHAWRTFPSLSSNPMMDQLEEGANHYSNRFLVERLGSCHIYHKVPASDLVRLNYQPERFWNLPLNDLLDCHYLAMITCAAHVTKERKQEAIDYTLSQSFGNIK